MSDYTKTTNFGAKDSLNTGDSNKLIKGSEFDTEFDNLATASATKLDSGNIATQAQAEALSSNVVLLTPLRLKNVLADNASMLQDIQALADPGFDTLLGWDDSANAIIGFTLGVGFLHSGTALTIDHDAATNFVADEHIAHAGVTITGVSNSGITGGGTIAASRTIGFDVAQMAEFGIADLFDATDEVVISDAGTAKRMDYQHFGIRVITITSSETLAIGHANTFIVAVHASVDIVLTIPANSSVAYKIGTFFHIMRNGAAEVDTAVTTDTFTATSGKSNRVNGAVLTVLKIAQTTWVGYGDSKA